MHAQGLAHRHGASNFPRLELSGPQQHSVGVLDGPLSALPPCNDGRHRTNYACGAGAEVLLRNPARPDILSDPKQGMRGVKTSSFETPCTDAPQNDGCMTDGCSVSLVTPARGDVLPGRKQRLFIPGNDIPSFSPARPFHGTQQAPLAQPSPQAPWADVPPGSNQSSVHAPELRVSAPTCVRIPEASSWNFDGGPNIGHSADYRCATVPLFPPHRPDARSPALKGHSINRAESPALCSVHADMANNGDDYPPRDPQSPFSTPLYSDLPPCFQLHTYHAKEPSTYAPLHTTIPPISKQQQQTCAVNDSLLRAPARPNALPTERHYSTLPSRESPRFCPARSNALRDADRAAPAKKSPSRNAYILPPPQPCTCAVQDPKQNADISPRPQSCTCVVREPQMSPDIPPRPQPCTCAVQKNQLPVRISPPPQPCTCAVREHQLPAETSPRTQPRTCAVQKTQLPVEISPRPQPCSCAAREHQLSVEIVVRPQSCTCTGRYVQVHADISPRAQPCIDTLREPQLSIPPRSAVSPPPRVRSCTKDTSVCTPVCTKVPPQQQYTAPTRMVGNFLPSTPPPPVVLRPPHRSISHARERSLPAQEYTSPHADRCPCANKSRTQRRHDGEWASTTSDEPASARSTSPGVAPALAIVVDKKRKGSGRQVRDSPSPAPACLNVPSQNILRTPETPASVPLFTKLQRYSYPTREVPKSGPLLELLPFSPKRQMHPSEEPIKESSPPQDASPLCPNRPVLFSHVSVIESPHCQAKRRIPQSKEPTSPAHTSIRRLRCTTPPAAESPLSPPARPVRLADAVQFRTPDPDGAGPHTANVDGTRSAVQDTTSPLMHGVHRHIYRRREFPASVTACPDALPGPRQTLQSLGESPRLTQQYAGTQQHISALYGSAAPLCPDMRPASQPTQQDGVRATEEVAPTPPARTGTDNTQPKTQGMLLEATPLRRPARPIPLPNADHAALRDPKVPPDPPSCPAFVHPCPAFASELPRMALAPVSRSPSPVPSGFPTREVNTRPSQQPPAALRQSYPVIPVTSSASCHALHVLPRTPPTYFACSAPSSGARIICSPPAVPAEHIVLYPPARPTRKSPREQSCSPEAIRIPTLDFAQLPSHCDCDPDVPHCDLPSPPQLLPRTRQFLLNAQHVTLPPATPPVDPVPQHRFRRTRGLEESAGCVIGQERKNDQVCQCALGRRNNVHFGACVL
eukprot:GEMP01001918.1.p1 GENE.GEMP01001918.1~~GEMP01001918.1.p1  ORF type:complete len:1204 (+),score=206.99 GEMP01001918.1:184-3795(+)